jgi:hypothetical protein
MKQLVVSSRLKPLVRLLNSQIYPRMSDALYVCILAYLASYTEQCGLYSHLPPPYSQHLASYQSEI